MLGLGEKLPVVALTLPPTLTVPVILTVVALKVAFATVVVALDTVFEP